jgi:hypothetical protein
MHDAAFEALFSGVLFMPDDDDSAGPILDKLRRIAGRQEWSASVTYIKLVFQISGKERRHGIDSGLMLGKKLSAGMFGLG